MNRIDIKSSEYPMLLKQIKDPPEFLYYKGQWNSEIFEQTLSVVGSRKMTTYGELITNEMITSIAVAGITIVSGFMYGIDAQAHVSTLNAGGHTIAVLPCGIDKIHPEYQEDLYNRIIDSHGLIVSEYPGDKPPALWTYPRRNRIIAGLSPILLVIEAGLKSGALITAGIAQKYNKRIYAVPGPLTSSVSRGTAHLIKEGASILTEPADILSEYNIQPKGKSACKNPSDKFNNLQRGVIDLLRQQSMRIDEIIRAMEKPAAEIGAQMTLLSLKKRIILQDGQYYLPEAITGETNHAD